jgi:hypothetical protein
MRVCSCSRRSFPAVRAVLRPAVPPWGDTGSETSGQRRCEIIPPVRKPRTLATMFFVPLIIGAVGLFQFTQRPGFAGFRNVDVVLLFGCGMCFGIALAGYSIHVDLLNLRFLVPALIGAVGLFEFTQRHGFAGFRSADVVLLFGCGMCFGVALAAVVVYLRRPRGTA